MLGKQAEAILSDLVMKCEEAGLRLPADPWDALAEALDALRSVNHHEMGRQQMDEALKILTSKFGGTPTAAKGKRKVPAKRGKRKQEAVDAIHPKAKRGKSSKAKEKAPVSPPTPAESDEPNESANDEEEGAEPAACEENQSLVDQFTELAKFEIKKGFTHRGRARLRVAKELHDTDQVIKSGAQARKLKGVGQASAAMVDKILNEGLQAALRECGENAKK